MLRNNKISNLFDWAKRQLHMIQESKPIVCLSLKDGNFRVGKLLVTQGKKQWAVNGYTFNYCKSAIYYSILIQLKKHNEADNLRMIDGYLCDLENSCFISQYRLNEAKTKKDWFKYDLVENKLSCINRKIIQTKNELDKIIKHAKYLNGDYENIYTN